MSHKNLSAKIKIPRILKDKLNNKKINQIYDKFENSLNINESFAVAVSGGPDSLALAFLSKVYSLKKNITSKFFIIDHKLRTDSTNEAKLVKKTLKRHFINAEILTWKGKKPFKNVQSIARKKRYDLLFVKCKSLNINNILLGHHSEDLVENFFMRMVRGSGLKGLTSLDKKSNFNNFKLIRPLLNEKKENLIFLSKYVFNFYIKDPSNNDDKYLRIKVRKIMQEFEKNGLDKKKMLITIKNLKSSNEVVNFYVNNNIKENTTFFNRGNKVILKNEFFNHSHEVIFRSLSDVLKLVSKRYYSVRGKKLDKFICNIRNNNSFKVTLGGCIIERVNQTIMIKKEH